MDPHVVVWSSGEEGEMLVAIVAQLGRLKAGRMQHSLALFAYGDTPVMVRKPPEFGAVADRIVKAVQSCGRQY